jgi:hypothetical protein
MMDDDAQTHEAPAAGKKRHSHAPDRSTWSPPGQVKKTPRPTWSGKTMHHPAFRVGELKHGK